MTTIGWAMAGFAAGVGLTSAAFVTLAPAPQRQPVPRSVPAMTPSSEVLKAPGREAASHNPNDVHEQLNNDPLGEVDVRARVAVMRWMAANPKYEFVMRDYCYCHKMPVTNCPQYEAERAREQSEYPYTDAGDYNNDGHVDVAIIVALKGIEGPNRLLIFNGPFGDGIPVPAYTVDGLEMYDQVHKGYIGPTDSDNGYVFEAKGKTYELKYVGAPP